MQQILIFFRGFLMGLADIVPGVSGGTIALVTGIYDRLIGALSDLSRNGWRVLLYSGWRVFWSSSDMTFLCVLGSGVLVSIVFFSQWIQRGLLTYPEAVWSFFLGLVVSSAIVMLRMIRRWSLFDTLWLVFGILISVWLSVQVPVQVDPSYLMIFFAGFVAIGAMLLPGISGSFILLLLGFYHVNIAALEQFEWDILLCFVLD